MLTFLKRYWKRVFIAVAAVFALLSLLLISSVYLGVWGKLPSKKDLQEIELHKATEVLAASGELLGKYYVDDRQPVTYQQIPKSTIQALIATEDARFYEHDGVDIKSLFRVLFKTILLQDRSSGGGSTISQQLAKNLYPRADHGSFSIVINKIREAIIAQRIEEVYSKEQVLTQYLNTVPFSDNTYGIESAAKKFFSKKASSLSLKEGAVLIGMLKANYNYNPRLFPKRSKERRNVVLSQMEASQFLTTGKADSLKSLPLEINYQSFGHYQGVAPYFRAQVRKELEAWCKKYNDSTGAELNIFTNGLKVHTTLDYQMQLAAEKAIAKHMPILQKEFEKDHGKNAPWLGGTRLVAKSLMQTKAYQKLKKNGLASREILDSLSTPHEIELFEWTGKEVTQSSTIDSLRHYLKFLNTGMLALDPKSGEVKSWIGGINYEYFQYDHVGQSKRQVGSTFKPFVYTAALENGMHPCAHISARTVSYKNLENWSPTNSGSIDPKLRYSVKAALSKSINTIAVKVLEDTGIKRTTALTRKMGLTADIPQVPSMALGTAEISLLELTAAYTSYVNGGKVVKPFFITRIEDNTGNVLQEFKPAISASPAYSERTRMVMLELMKETIATGTARRIRSQYNLKNAMAGKTGTTQNNKDAWFMSITPKLVVGSWVGTEDYRIGFRSTKYGQGAHAALPNVAYFLQNLNEQEQFNTITKAKFPEPSSAITSLLDCPESSEEPFLKRLFGSNKKSRSFDKKTRKRKKKKGWFGRR